MNSKSDVLKTLGSILDDEQGKLKLSNAQSYEDLYELYKDYEGKLNINDFKQEFDKFVCSRINKAGLSEDNLQTVSGGKGSKVTSALMAGLATISSAGMGASAGHFVSSPTSSKQIIEKSKSFVKNHPWITTSVGVGVPTTLGLGALALYLFTHSEKEPGPSPGDGGSGGNGGNNPGYKKDEYNENFWSSRNDEDKKLTYTKENHYKEFDSGCSIPEELNGNVTGDQIMEYLNKHKNAASKIFFKDVNVVEFGLNEQKQLKSATVAVVNAANTGLGSGNGVCGAIFSGDGPSSTCAEVNKWRKDTGVKGCIKYGDAMIQRATRLRDKGIKYIIQTPGPNLRDDPKPSSENAKKQLFNAYTNSIELAVKNKCTEVMFPAISTKEFQYPENEASILALQAVIKALEEKDEAGNLRVCLTVYGMEQGATLKKIAGLHAQFMSAQSSNSPGDSGERVVTAKKEDKGESKDQNSGDGGAPEEKPVDSQPISHPSSPSPAPSPDLSTEELHEDETTPVQTAPVVAAETNATAKPQVVEELVVEEPHQEDKQDSGAAASTTETQAPVVNTVLPEVAQPVVQKNQPSVEKPNPTSTASKPPQSSSSSAGAAASRTSPTTERVQKKKNTSPEPPSTKPQGEIPESKVNTTSSDKTQKHGFSLSRSFSSLKNRLSTNKSTGDKKTSKASSTKSQRKKK